MKTTASWNLDSKVTADSIVSGNPRFCFAELYKKPVLGSPTPGLVSSFYIISTLGSKMAVSFLCSVIFVEYFLGQQRVR